MNKIVLIVDVRCLIRKSKSTIERHKLYADKLKEISHGQYSLWIIYPGGQIPGGLESDGNLTFISISRNPFLAYWSMRELLKRGALQVKLLVAGDPWESFVFARLIKKLFFPKSRIQMQVHGDIGNPIWINASMRNFVRSLLTAITIRKADELRVTTESQGAWLTSRFRVKKDFFRVIPVPSNLANSTPVFEVLGDRPHSLGFVGRIQKDRGLDEFVKLVKKLNALDSRLMVVVAGGGPEEKILRHQLSEFLPKERIKFLGEIESAEMGSVWSQIGVLASTAPTESYGRAIREALANGVPVWAIPSSGAHELHGSVSDGTVRFIDLDSSAKELFDEFSELLRVKVNPEFGHELSRNDQKSLLMLIQSWLGLAEKQE